MFEPQLFLGFLVDPLYEDQLSHQNPHLVDQLVIQEIKDISSLNSTYLLKKRQKGMLFLGKHLGKKATFEEIELLERHIYSLLKKLVISFPYHETALYLFPVLDLENPLHA